MSDQMKMLIGFSNTRRTANLPEPLRNFITQNHVKPTLAGNWISILNYAAVEKYSAVLLQWKIVKNVYPDFVNKLKNINTQFPVIIILENDVVESTLLENVNQLFAILPLQRIEASGRDLIKRLNKYHAINQLLGRGSNASFRPNGFGPFIGNSMPMLELYHQLVKVAKTDYSVLILGESGSGKELVAQTLHDLSTRWKKPFVSINCAAIPESLLESELFGYEKGAFTGADSAKKGKFEIAHGGTLFLDEIGDMTLPLQAKLLRVLEDKLIERLGQTTKRSIDIRLLAATNQDLTNLIDEKKFRTDLHFRLNVIQLSLKPLQDRKDDLTLLTIHFLRKLLPKSPNQVRTIAWNLFEELQLLPISGNVRELENLLTKVIFFSDSVRVSRDDLLYIQEQMNTSRTSDQIENLVVAPLWKLEKNAIQQALDDYNGNITRVAEVLEISRPAIYRKIKKYKLTISQEGNHGNDE